MYTDWLTDLRYAYKHFFAFTFDVDQLDLWPWISGELYTRKDQEIEWKQTSGRTDTTDRITFPSNAVSWSSTVQVDGSGDDTWRSEWKNFKTESHQALSFDIIQPSCSVAIYWILIQSAS